MKVCGSLELVIKGNVGWMKKCRSTTKEEKKIKTCKKNINKSLFSFYPLDFD